MEKKWYLVFFGIFLLLLAVLPLHAQTPTTQQTGTGTIANKQNDSNQQTGNQQTGNTQQTASLEAIIKRMAKQGITAAQTVEEYKPHAGLTRQEAAKMIVHFMLAYELQRNANPSPCGFEDIYSASKVFIPYILSVCSMNIMRGTGKRFFPTAQLSKAEALAILLRMFKREFRTSVKPWYKNYYTFGVAYGIIDTDITEMEKLITRGEFARMLYAIHLYFQE